MDAMQLRILYVFTDLVMPLVVGYWLHQKHWMNGTLCNRMILVNIIGLGTMLSVLSFWMMPLTLELIWLPIFGVLLCVIPGTIGHFFFERNYDNILEQGAYLAAASLSNIGTLGGLCNFILYGEIGFAYTQMVGLFQNLFLLLVCFPIAQIYRQKYENSTAEKNVRPNLFRMLCSWKQLPVVGMIAGMLLYAQGIERPAVLGSVFEILVHAGAWLALLPIGYLIDFSRAKAYYRKTLDVLPVKFMLTPIVTYLCSMVLFDDAVLRGAMVVMATAPTAINAVVTARLFKLNVDLTIASFLSTTVAYLFVIFPMIFFYITSGGRI